MLFFVLLLLTGPWDEKNVQIEIKSCEGLDVVCHGFVCFAIVYVLCGLRFSKLTETLTN